MTWARRGLRALKRALDFVLAQIDSESVRPYQRVIYALYLTAGIWAAITGLPGAVDMALGHHAAQVWICLLIGAPLATFAGVALEKCAVRCPSTLLAALILQITGDTGMAFASWAFTAALSSTIYAGEATFASWVVGGLGLCALALTVRGVRKLLAGMVVARKVIGGNE